MKYLTMLKIFDQDKTLSLTNLMMVVLIIKVAVAPSLDFEMVCAMFLALASYNAKKVFAKLRSDKEQDAAAQVETDKSEMEWIKGELRALTQIINLRK